MRAAPLHLSTRYGGSTTSGRAAWGILRILLVASSLLTGCSDSANVGGSSDGMLAADGAPQLDGSAQSDMPTTAADLFGVDPADLAGFTFDDMGNVVRSDLAGAANADLTGASSPDLVGSAPLDLAGSPPPDLQGASDPDLLVTSPPDLNVGVAPDLAMGAADLSATAGLDLAGPVDLATTADQGCSAATCPNGCCQKGTCVAWSRTTCGVPGSACAVCPIQADTCVNGTCSCGAGGSACPSTLACTFGQCVCNLAVCTNGCCMGNTCLSGNDNNACGQWGRTCMDCGSLGASCVTKACQCNQPDQFFCTSAKACVTNCNACPNAPIACASTKQCVANCQSQCSNTSACYGSSNTCVASCATNCGSDNKTCTTASSDHTCVSTCNLLTCPSNNCQ